MMTIFALACMFAYCSADFSLADDSSMTEVEFKDIFGVDSGFEVALDTDDGEGFHLTANRYIRTNTLNFTGDELDHSILAIGENIAFTFYV